VAMTVPRGSCRRGVHADMLTVLPHR
jgi:hypothetical protein